ncbi:MAG: 16S rRNA (cytosine(1402)-N(4))-methyltransferase [Candidatus Vogelbacteria bacterium CG10_big_fil_rev_8_21_14_0_10_49_38]|uniref:Ribosomal RNA small subunit methyltransferase H n=1 Tax=Candidatus Vogelbacteria bacterium CG10_big_fil_rev_8_21_14_0_10_49_38 TaxID=1975043 RepID=A0A2H0RHF6_9BACT|nr:MAG: 16S rRNA (cytosine(1402)-N(4))-methyltransferase [bacterium CG10_49_38]PIR45991.1 MAG: 16S rRNA (cytosine(1402)-N(4))-methyltransferase [Candidatus Vogelbacteria bacterium CG10_big_fil_rev_8_21_14_0_10_49_38]
MHVPVLLQSTIEQLNPEAGQILLDATLGLGGHARALAARLGPTGTLIGLEADGAILARARTNLEAAPARLILVQANFRSSAKILDEQGVRALDGALFDLGFNSRQLVDSGRGFSFQQDEPLLMTLSDQLGVETLTAAEIVNEWSEDNLADIIYAYGEEPASRKIATAIVAARAIRPIKTTFDLLSVFEAAGLKRRGKIHPATKTFQALRIAVNDELGALKEGLVGVWSKLAPRGKLAVISFHSLEARIIKDFFRDKVAREEGFLVTKSVILPDRVEILANPRSRSAQLRVIKKII